MTPDNDDWLSLEPPIPDPVPPPARRRKRRKRAPVVTASSKLPNERPRALTMQRKLYGKNRIWACDGEYVFFRPFRYIDGVRTQVANPTTYERHQRFLAAGHYTHVETSDDVEIYRVNPTSPFARKGLYTGELTDRELRMQVAKAAARRDWVLYTDVLEELAGRVKNRGYSEAYGKQVWQDTLEYLDVMIRNMGGPSEAERGSGLAAVRQSRGVGQGRMIMVPGRR